MTLQASQAFAVWLTGLPASGKSTIAAALRARLEAQGLCVEVLESDEVRRILTPAPTYSYEERNLFYRALAFLASRLVKHGVTVIIDATATKRAYRELARTLITPFFEVAVECPLNVCMARDQKGTYRKGLTGESTSVPGLQDAYEPPLSPDVRIDSSKTAPDVAADSVMAILRSRRLVA